MKRINLTLVVTLLFYSFCSYSQQRSMAPQTSDLKSFCRELSNYRNILQLPGMAVAVVKDGGMIWVNCCGVWQEWYWRYL